MTSDSFFSTNQKNFDCIFIDGLYTYEQAKKDVINSINVLNENGMIFLMIVCLKVIFIKQHLDPEILGMEMFGK